VPPCKGSACPCRRIVAGALGTRVFFQVDISRIFCAANHPADCAPATVNHKIRYANHRDPSVAGLGESQLRVALSCPARRFASEGVHLIYLQQIWYYTVSCDMEMIIVLLKTAFLLQSRSKVCFRFRCLGLFVPRVSKSSCLTSSLTGASEPPVTAYDRGIWRWHPSISPRCHSARPLAELPLVPCCYRPREQCLTVFALRRKG
jgi:hypothetical protein